MIPKIKNMNTPFTLGQIVRLKNYKRNELEKEAYFVVIEENDDTNELVLYTLNTNRYYKSGATIIPENPEEDFQIVQLKSSDLLQEEVTLIKGRTENELTGIVFDFLEEDTEVVFTLVNSFLVSNIKVDYHTSKNQWLRGNIHIAMHY